MGASHEDMNGKTISKKKKTVQRLPGGLYLAFLRNKAWWLDGGTEGKGNRCDCKCKRSPYMQGLAGHCKDFGFYSV